MNKEKARHLLAKSTRRTRDDSVVSKINEADRFAKHADVPLDLARQLSECRQLAAQLQSKLVALAAATKALDDDTSYELPAGIDPQAQRRRLENRFDTMSEPFHR